MLHFTAELAAHDPPTAFACAAGVRECTNKRAVECGLAARKWPLTCAKNSAERVGANPDVTALSQLWRRIGRQMSVRSRRPRGRWRRHAGDGGDGAADRQDAAAAAAFARLPVLLRRVPPPPPLRFTGYKRSTSMTQTDYYTAGINTYYIMAPQSTTRLAATLAAPPVFPKEIFTQSCRGPTEGRN